MGGKQKRASLPPGESNHRARIGRKCGCADAQGFVDFQEIFHPQQTAQFVGLRLFKAPLTGKLSKVQA